MKILSAFTCVLLLLFSCKQNREATSEQPELNVQTQQISYNAKLAEQLGADEYGMRKYVLAILKRGPNQDFSEEESQNLQRSHLNNISRLAKEGKLVLAGPFLDKGSLRGIYVFDVETVEEAEKLTKTDPAIQAGKLVMELHPWYGSAALLKMNEIHNQVAKEQP